MPSRPKPFQYQLAFWGSFIFLASFQASEFLSNNSYEYWSKIFTGYSLGFIFSFASLVILEMLRGNSYKFIDENPIFRPLSYLSLFVIIVLACLAFYTTNYTTISYGYNSAVGIGSIVCAFGLVPVISYHEN